MNSRSCVSAMVVALIALLGPALASGQDRDEPFLFAVVTKPPKDRTVITAHVMFEGVVSETKLLPVEGVVTNPVWRSLEICHSLRAEVRKAPEGFQVLSAKALDASMLPMGLQSIAGDCLIKKAVEVAPLVD